MSNVVETKTDVETSPGRATEAQVASKVAVVPEEQPVEDVEATYTQELDEKLDANQRETEQVREAIAKLQARLPLLAKNRETLTAMRESLSGRGVSASGAQEPHEVSDEVAAEVPHPRKARAGTKAGASTPRASSGKTSKDKSKTPARGRRGVSSSELVYTSLCSRPGRWRVSEILEDVQEAIKREHPDLAVTDQWVRNALNTLISKGRVERSEQGNARFFEAVQGKSEGAKSVGGARSQ